jgi:hypothetical protein
LLGAGCGCSVSNAAGTALIPAVDVLTTRICDSLSRADTAKSLAALKKQYSDDGEASPNIEKLLSRIRVLREIAGTGSVRGLSAGDLDLLDDRVCREIENIVSANLPSGDTSYSRFARWIREIDRSQAVEIFTTNYDLLLEESLERVRAPFFDGFIGSHEPFFDVSAMDLDHLPERWTRVWKIHGSINWRLTPSGAIVRSREASQKPLIFPSHLKYAESRRLPYLAMRDRLRIFLKERGILITCGYSFSDEHINEDILFGLAASPSSVCYALMFTPMADSADAKKLAIARPNLNVLAPDGGVLRGNEVVWSAGGAMDLGDFAAFGRFVEEQVTGQSHASSI